MGSEGKIVNGRHNPWREVLDPTSKQLYYHNTETNVTQWERPVEMGAAPHATGWFGRGAAGSTAAARYEAENVAYLARPARKQAEQKAGITSVLEGAYEYNIWYNKYIGDHWSGKNGKDPAESRCDVARDAGYTKADKNSNNAKHFCLFFARGCCAYGHTCHFFHRIPVKDDIALLLKDELCDCFGRTRHKDHRDDMDGVGSVMKPCRTLYVGNLSKSKYKSPQELEKALWTGFGEWGEIESVNLISRLSIAFVRYRFRASAEFAKEAMGNQALGHEEVMNIRWAYDDPNPVALEASQRADADAVMNMMSARGVDLVGVQSQALPDAGAAINAAACGVTSIAGTVPSQSPSTPLPSSLSMASAASVLSSASTQNASGAPAPSEAERQAAWAAYYAQLGSAQSQQMTKASDSGVIPKKDIETEGLVEDREDTLDHTCQPPTKRFRKGGDDERHHGAKPI